MAVCCGIHLYQENLLSAGFCHGLINNKGCVDSTGLPLPTLELFRQIIYILVLTIILDYIEPAVRIQKTIRFTKFNVSSIGYLV